MKFLLHKLFISLSLFALFIAGFFHPITAFTQDLGRHLRSGQIILQSHTVPKTNLFSYTFSSFPFINSHWLAQVVLYLVTQVATINGLLIFSTTIACIAFGIILFFAMQRYSLLVCLASGIFYLLILFERTDIRPEIFSFLFTAVFVVVLYRYREKKSKLIYLLIPVELLWVNMHIYFPIGILLLVLFLLDEVLTKRKLQTAKTKTLAFVIAATILVTFCNPNGVTGALFPVFVFSNYGIQIEENQNIFLLQSHFNDTPLYVLIAAIVILFFSFVGAYKKTRIIDLLLWLVFSIVAVVAIRNLPLFVFATYLSFVHTLTASTGSVKHALISLIDRQKLMLLIYFVYFTLICIFFTVATKVISQHQFGFGVKAEASGAADFFINHHLLGPIYNNIDIGSYLIYRLYPKEKVFVDARPEAYPASFFQNIYIPLQSRPGLFTNIDRNYHFSSIFLNHFDKTSLPDAFLYMIVHNRNWSIVYLDDSAIILLKRNTTNQYVIDKYLITEQNFLIPQAAKTASLLRFAYFFQKAGWKNQEKKTYQKIFRKKPLDCPVDTSFSKDLQTQNDPDFTYYQQQLQVDCPKI